MKFVGTHPQSATIKTLNSSPSPFGGVKEADLEC